MPNLHKFENSSSLVHCDYNDDDQTLIIKFTSGHVYHYPNCDKMQYEALKQASSPGAHFHKHIRKLSGVKVS